MQPYFIVTAGGYLSTTYPAGSTTWYDTAARYRSLNVSSAHGNFKDPTPFSFEKAEWGYLKGQTGTFFGGGVYTITDGYGPGSVCNHANSCDASALDPYNKCLDKLYSGLRSDVDLSIDIYQGKQTVKMVLDFYNTIRHPLDNFVKLSQSMIQRHKIVRSTKLAGSKWLEFQYGIRPTMNTIHSLTSDLVGALSAPGGFQIARARASSLDEVTKVKLVEGNFWVEGIPAIVHSVDRRRCEISLWYTIGNEDLNALSQFSSLNPASFLYENIPFSFVLDWVWDLGGYLRMMETALATGLVFKGGYRTDTRYQSGDVTVKGDKSEFGTVTVFEASGSWSLRKCDRVLLTSMPLPTVPSFAPKLGSERLLSAASLLSNFLNVPPPSKRR